MATSTSPPGDSVEASAPSWLYFPETPLTDYTSTYPGCELHNENGRGNVHCDILTPNCDVSDPAVETDVLPSGWRAATDPASGVLYFYHEETSRSQWERPQGSIDSV